MTEQEPVHQSITGNYNAQVSGSGSATVHVYQSVIPQAIDADTLVAAQNQRDAIPHDQIPPIAALIPNSVMPFHHNRAFVGRQNDLLYVAQHLRDSTTPGAALVLTGMGGIGKTQLASEIVHRYGPFFAGGVFWLSCADPDIVPGEIAACGARGLVDWRPDYLNLSQEEQVQLVLSAWQSPLPRLLVFDNCEYPALLARWHPTTGGCTVLVTSRRPTWPSTMEITVYPLEVLQRSESITLLRHFRPDLALDDPDLDALAQELGDLPLALHLAGSYLAVMRHAVTPADYLAEVQAPDLLTHPSLQGWEQTNDTSPTRHIQDIGRTFAISYHQLDRTNVRDQAAQQILAHIAAGAPGESMSRAVLYAIQSSREIPPHEQESVLRRLIDLGLLDQSSIGAVRLHRLLAAFMQRYTIPENVIAALTHALVSVATQQQQSGSLTQRMDLHPHFRHVAQSFLQTPELATAEVDLCYNVASYLHEMGDYTVARPLHEQVLTITEQVHGPDHPDMAVSLDNLARVLQDQGDYTTAYPLFERALAITEQIFGSNHPNTAISLDSLAGLLHDQGNYAAARTLFERALTIREHTLEPDHLHLALSLNNVAGTLRAQGDYLPARPLYEQALTITEQVRGPNHPDTATNLGNLAGLLHAQGNYTAARPLYERALAIREQTLGLDHPHTALSLNSLALLLKDEGNYVGARPLYERALKIHEQALGPHHPYTATVLSNLARVLQDQGDYIAAYPLFERALAITEKIVGPTHPNTGTYLNNLAGVFHRLGNYTAARPLFERALAIREKTLGPEHPDTAQSLNNLAGVFRALGDYTTARSLYKQALTITEQTLGSNHPHTNRVRRNLAACNPSISQRLQQWIATLRKIIQKTVSTIRWRN